MCFALNLKERFASTNVKISQNLKLDCLENGKFRPLKQKGIIFSSQIGMARKE
jgi:hypothetical protein